MRPNRLVPTMAGLILISTACSSGEPSSSQVVASISEETLVPAIESTAESISNLADVVAGLCQDPTGSNLEIARAAWHHARQTWREAELVTYFGPAEMLRTLSMVDYLPISEEGIEDLLASDTEIDPDYIENRAASTQRGLGTVEYLLFEQDGAVFDARRCLLSSGAARVAADQADELRLAWTDAYRGGPSYADQFVEMEIEDSMADLVGALVASFHQQGSRELGTALGATEPEPDPAALPDGRAGSATGDYLARARGIIALLEAGGGQSLITLIRVRSPEVADRIDAALSELVTSLEGLPDTPMARLLTEDPGRLETVYHPLSELHTLFEADVVSTLDITLGFSDTDGDSG